MVRAGRIDIVDVMPVIGAYNAYCPLRDNPRLFATARLTDDGYAVAWDGLDADMAAETTEPVAVEADADTRRTV